MDTEDTGSRYGIDQSRFVYAISPSVPSGNRLPAVANGPDRVANARLIAAAPEMLDALRSAVASMEKLVGLGRIPENMSGLRDARAAIAKAEGTP